jgi:hypothetical protein
MVLLFVSLGLLVFFADLVHSIQVDAIMQAVQRNTIAVIRDGLLAGCPWPAESGSGSSAPWSKTPHSGSGSWPTWRARRCRRRSTTPTPRSRPSITYR